MNDYLPSMKSEQQVNEFSVAVEFLTSLDERYENGQFLNEFRLDEVNEYINSISDRPPLLWRE